MFEININVRFPELLAAVTALGSVLNHPTTAPATEAVAVQAAAENPTPAPIMGGPTAVTAPTATAQTGPTQSVRSPSDEAPAPGPVPVAPAPTYTKEQISKAGADMLAADPGKLDALRGLLGKYGVLSIVEIPEDKLGAFATELRALGAKI